MPSVVSKEEEQAPMSIRAGSPPARISSNQRKLVTPQFSSFQPRSFHRTGSDHINKVVWSCDGKRLVSCSNNKEVKLWDIERSLDSADQTLTGSTKDPVNHVACHPTHPQLLCSASRKGSLIYFWDARRFKKELSTIPLAADSVAYSPDAQTVMAIDRSDNMRIIDCRMVGSSEPTEWTLREESLRMGSDGGSDSVYQAIFNHVGDMVFLAKEDGQLAMVEYPSLNLWHSLSAHATACYTIALDPRGRYLASGGADGFVNFFETTEFIATRTVPTVDSGIRVLSFSYDGEYVAAGCAEQNAVYIIATETGELVHRISCLGTPSTVAWHPSRHLLAFGGDNEYGPASRSRWLSIFGS